MRVLVTGYPGTIGAPLVRDFLSRGIKVIAIVRPVEGRQVALEKGLSVIYGDITEEMIDPTILKKFGPYDAFFHLAGKVQYHEDLRQETLKANVTGTRKMLELSALLEIERFVYTSTSYVGEKMAYLGESDVAVLDDSLNPYLLSKIQAEELVRQYLGRPLIIRLSTVIGDSESGEVGRVGGYSGFVAPIYVIRKRLAQFPNNPFLMGLNPESTMNLVPREWAIRMIRCAGLSGIDGTVHVTHPKPVPMGWLFEETFIKNLALPLTYSHDNHDRTSRYGDPRWLQIQSRVTKIVEYFGSFVQRDTTYGHEKIRKTDGYVSPAEIDSRLIANQISYMRNVLLAPPQRLRSVAHAA